MKQKIYLKNGLDFVVIGKTTETKNLSLRFKNEIVATILLVHYHQMLRCMRENGLKKKANKNKLRLKELKK